MASNYRPILTLSVFNKVYEKLIYLRLSEFLTTNNAISDTQFGFRRNCTTHAVFHLVADLRKSFHNKSDCTSLFLDLRKVFDNVRYS